MVLSSMQQSLLITTLSLSFFEVAYSGSSVTAQPASERYQQCYPEEYDKQYVIPKGGDISSELNELISTPIPEESTTVTMTETVTPEVTVFSSSGQFIENLTTPLAINSTATTVTEQPTTKKFQPSGSSWFVDDPLHEKHRPSHHIPKRRSVSLKALRKVLVVLESDSQPYTVSKPIQVSDAHIHFCGINNEGDLGLDARIDLSGDWVTDLMAAAIQVNDGAMFSASNILFNGTGWSSHHPMIWVKGGAYVRLDESIFMGRVDSKDSGFHRDVNVDSGSFREESRTMIFLDSEEKDGSLEIQDSMFYQGVLSGSVIVTKGGALTVSDSRFVVANRANGVLGHKSEITILDSVFRGCHVNEDNTGKTPVTSSSFCKISSEDGGSAFIGDRCHLNMARNNFGGGWADLYGALYLRNDQLKVGPEEGLGNTQSVQSGKVCATDSFVANTGALEISGAFCPVNNRPAESQGYVGLEDSSSAISWKASILLWFLARLGMLL